MDDPNTGVEVVMIQRDLARAPIFSLPPGYAMRAYREGDVANWVRIQQAGDPFFVAEARHFSESMPGNTAYLEARVLFLVDGSGTDIGTIAAWNDAEFEGREMGHIHWVAIVSAAQGRSLAKPMLSVACAALRTHGYTEAWLETNTARIPALNLYGQFGFKPHPRNEAEREAWRAVAPRLKFAVEV